jgi:hypothetical protein
MQDIQNRRVDRARWLSRRDRKRRRRGGLVQAFRLICRIRAEPWKERIEYTQIKRFSCRENPPLSAAIVGKVPARWAGVFMKNFLLVGILFLLWVGSMTFYLPLPVVVVLFAALVSSASLIAWLSLVRRWGGAPRTIVKRDAKT